ncbi:methyltransferase MppJ [Xylaria cubensis]|nr:methyltransferase MppJ [Xylaria cubensis]
MDIDANDAKCAVANIFNSALAALGAAWEPGSLDEPRENKRLDVEEYSSKDDLHPLFIQGLVTILVTVKVLAPDQTKIIDPTFRFVMDSVKYTFPEVVDLGCGSGGRLMQIPDRYPRVKGLDIDISVPSTKVAQDEAAEHGYGSRLAFSEGDVLKLSCRDEFSNVDLLSCFMMNHGFLVPWKLYRHAPTHRRVFPQTHRFLLGDADVPLFVLGFEFSHGPGWRCVKRHLTDSRLPLWVTFELEHA